MKVREGPGERIAAVHAPWLVAGIGGAFLLLGVYIVIGALTGEDAPLWVGLLVGTMGAVTLVLGAQRSVVRLDAEAGTATLANQRFTGGRRRESFPLARVERVAVETREDHGGTGHRLVLRMRDGATERLTMAYHGEAAIADAARRLDAWLSARRP
ncbi:MAG: hypothetical protein ACU0BS_07455 [Hasllibacter sp.]